MKQEENNENLIGYKFDSKICKAKSKIFLGNLRAYFLKTYYTKIKGYISK